MAGLTHEHRESPDPRRIGFCACGHRMFRGRDREFEHQIVREACDGHTDPDVLSHIAQLRADAVGGRLRTNMDWLAEGEDELADLLNYLVWDFQEHFDAALGERRELLALIAGTVGVFNRVRELKQQRRLG